MPRYAYRCAEANGSRTEGSGDFLSLRELERQLASRGATLLWMREIKEARPGEKRHRTLKSGELEEFTNLLAALLESGLTLRDALDVVATASSNASVVSFARDVSLRIDSGRSLDGAFDNLNVDLPVIYRGLVRIGEKTGAMEKVYPRLAHYMSSEKRSKERLLNAMMYPLIVLVFAILGTIALTFYLLPRLSSLFGEMSGAAGSALKSRIAVATVVSVILSCIMILAAVGIPLIAALRRKNERIAHVADGFMLRLPVIGPFLRDRETLAFAFAMESLTSGGLTIDDSLAECARAAGNRAIAADIGAMRDMARNGASLSVACGNAKNLPVYLRQWLAVGERTGQVDRVFGQVRAYYQASTDRSIERLMSLAEPMIMLVVGVIIIALIVLFVLPIFTAYGSLL